MGQEAHGTGFEKCLSPRWPAEGPWAGGLPSFRSSLLICTGGMAVKPCFTGCLVASADLYKAGPQEALG